MKQVYSTTVRVEGGREGQVTSADGLLALGLGLPKELGGSGKGTNPEQLFGAGYAACFESALRFVARARKIAVGRAAVDAEVRLFALATGGFALGLSLHVQLPEIDQALAEELAREAHRVCPYSNATRGNLDVTIDVTGAA